MDNVNFLVIKMIESTLVSALNELNHFKTTDYTEDALKSKCEKFFQTLECSYGDVLQKVGPVAHMFDSKKVTYEWKYVCMNFYILELLKDELSKSSMNILSVQHIKVVKSALCSLMLHGVLENLEPNLPHWSVTKPKDNDSIYCYNVLKCTLIGFHTCLTRPNLRMLILPQFLQGLLVGTFQIAYGQLKKPSTAQLTPNQFCMTEDTYAKLMSDQRYFREILEKLYKTIHPAIIIKETMTLFQSNSPLWFRKAISGVLTKRLLSKNGVEHITAAMLNGMEDDITKTWQIIDVLTKLIISCRKFSDFRENICTQILNLLDFTGRTDYDILVFERLVVSCTKALYIEDETLGETVFVNRLLLPLKDFAIGGNSVDDSTTLDLTKKIEQSSRLLHSCLVDETTKCLPVAIIKSLVKIIFRFYQFTTYSKLSRTNNEFKEIMMKFLQECAQTDMEELLDGLMFNFPLDGVLDFRRDVIVEVGEKIIVKKSEHTILPSTADITASLVSLLDTERKIILFGYLLKCITNKERYFLTQKSNDDLLASDDVSSNVVFGKLLAIYQLLSDLSDDKSIQDFLQQRPDLFIGYVKDVLNGDSDDEFSFIIVMILDNLISGCSDSKLIRFKELSDPLKNVSAMTNNTELRNLCNKLINILSGDLPARTNKTPGKKTKFQVALEDVCDPLLPTRGHGLLTLAKLIEEKNEEALERKQYLLNLFQLCLKDEDSFIYLNAVHGLVALADVFTDTVVEVLSEEFSDFNKKHEQKQETRLKLGEALVRVIKMLGDMAPKYKALLLNTFLSGAKDDDDLVRASSLSNLGEVCRVLNYKLGTIITEVIVCVHAIIATDKSPEARRAAVTVIRQLFVGLQTDMMIFLKEDILPIYRTLKNIYYDDEDDVMRLQAQLALEELNENIKNAFLNDQQLHAEKPVIQLL